MRLLHLGAERRRERVEVVLGAAIRRADDRERNPAQHRGHVDDVPGAALLEVRQHLLHPVERRLHVDLHHLVDVLVRELRRHPRDAAPDVVDPDVDAPVAADRRVDHAAHVGTHGRVRRERERARTAALRDRPERVGVPRDQRDRSALARQELGCCRADACAGAGDDDDFVHGGSSLRRGAEYLGASKARAMDLDGMIAPLPVTRIAESCPTRLRSMPSEERAMTDTAIATGNDDAIEAWNTILFDKFVRFRHLLTQGLSAHGEAALGWHPPRRGARAIDLGCGFGDTTMPIAGLVGPGGDALGVDCSARFVDSARADAAAAGIANVRFEVRDIEADALGGPYDYAFSRFGIMFCANPVAALRNVRASTEPDGELCCVVWRKRDDNPWVFVAQQVVERFVPKGDHAEHVTCGPGPFSMASADLVS